jgi:hypothetical protein
MDKIWKELGLTRYCCRSNMKTSIDTTSFLMKFKEQNIERSQRLVQKNDKDEFVDSDEEEDDSEIEDLFQ